MAPKPETTFYQNEVRKVFERAQILVENMHGGMYQVGIPDKLLILPKRKFRTSVAARYPADGAPSEFVLVELKYCTKRRAPDNAAELVHFLDGRQRQVVMKWALRSAPVFVMCGSELHPNECSWVNCRQIVKCTEDSNTRSTFGSIVQFTKEVLLGNLGIDHTAESW